MRKSMKKAFTITELVIVIAVVAILAAVLIPTFSNVIEKANVSNDTVLVKNLNTALSSYEALNGKPSTMHEALTAVAEEGFLVEKLTPRSTGDILWEQASNRFVLSKDNEIVFGDALTTANLGYTYWEIVKEMPTENTNNYSLYLADGFTIEGALAVSTGIDVGNNSDISINYTNESATAQDVVFRTNGGTLTVNGELDTVSHYGSANVIDIVSVAGESYHEYGTVLGNISIAKGRVVIENEAEVSSVLANAKGLLVNSDETLEQLQQLATRVEIKFADESKANQTSVGIMMKGHNNTFITSEELGTIITGVLQTVLSENNFDSVESSIVSTPILETINSKFAGGMGTESSPYLIETAEQFYNVLSNYHYKLLRDIEVEKAVSNLQHSVLDGQGYSITMVNETYLFTTILNSTIKNLNVKEVKAPLVLNAKTNNTFINVDVSGKMDVDVSAGNNGVYVVYAYPVGNNKVELTYIDCDCNVDFSGGTYNAVFTGYAFPQNNGVDRYTTLNYDNCTYSGTFVSQKASMFLGNNSAGQGIVTINVNNCRNEGQIISTTTETNYKWNSYISTGLTDKCTITLNGEELGSETVLEPMGLGFVWSNDENLGLTQNEDGTFTIAASLNTNVAYYVVNVGLYSSLIGGGTLVQSVSERIELTAFENGTATTALKNIQFVDETWVANNSSATKQTFGEGEYSYTVYSLNGVDYYYLPINTTATLNGVPKAAQMISVSCYDANGTLIATCLLQG